MCLALDEDGVDIHITVPSQTDSLCTLSLLETALIQFPGVCVVVVDGRDGRVLDLKLLARVEDQHRQVLEDDELELGDVVGVDPVFCCLTDEVLLASSGGRITLGGVAASADLVVEL